MELYFKKYTQHKCNIAFLSFNTKRFKVVAVYEPEDLNILVGGPFTPPMTPPKPSTPRKFLIFIFYI